MLIDSLARTARLSEVFADASVLSAMLEFERALATVEARLGVIPASAAEAVRAAAVADRLDVAELTRLALRAGTPVIPLVKMLQSRGAVFAHFGATSQDVTDTALALLLQRCRAVLAPDHARLVARLRMLSEEYASTVMVGRTLLQPAPPVTFGLTAAGWFAALQRGWSRVGAAFDEACCLQFGGASGTLAMLEGQGIEVAVALAAELGLRCPDAPWHAHRDRLGALLSALTVYTGSLGKMAFDVALLMQAGEVAEPGGDGRGGSSTMPHKRNPTACMLAVGAARRIPGLLASFLAGMVSEHERGLGGWQSEWTLAQEIVQCAGVALESMVEVAEGLTVDPQRMRANIDPAVFAEKSRAAALLGGDVTVSAPEEYLGSAEAFRLRQLLGSSTPEED
jgi:3-carboxy-cis,cis-muconate cycloisomerase